MDWRSDAAQNRDAWTKANAEYTDRKALASWTGKPHWGVWQIPDAELGVIGDVVMDLAVGLGAPFQKNGAPRSGERIEKLNFLLRAAEGIPNCALADVQALVRF